MTVVVVLFAVGVLLLAADVFISSYFLAIVGATVMFSGCVAAYENLGYTAALASLSVALALLSGALYVELAILPKSRFGRQMIVESTVSATAQPAIAQSEKVLGKTAQAVTILAPSGYVLVEGQRYEAFSQSGHASKGDLLKVVGLDNFRLIVSKL